MTIDGTAAPSWGDRPQGMSWTRSVQSIWKTWLLTRILIIGAAAASSVVVDEPLSGWVRRWDAGWFLHIAEHGYRDSPESPAFYPLYPALLRAGGDALGGHPALAGFLLSFPVTLCAFALLAALASHHVGEEQSARAVAYLAVFPTAFFLQALYSEALFLVFAVGAFIAAERRRFLPAAGLAGAAMLTRPLGVAVLAGLVLFALREPAPRAALARISVAPLVFALYPLFLVLDGRDPLAFSSAESHWRETSTQGALRGPYLAAKSAWTGVRDLAGGYDYVALLNVTAFAVLVAFGCLSVVAWRRLGAPYGAYCLVSLAMQVAAPAAPWPLASIQRYVLTLFPCFIVLGALPIGRRWHRVLLTLSAALLILLIVWWTQGKFVA